MLQKNVLLTRKWDCSNNRHFRAHRKYIRGTLPMTYVFLAQLPSNIFHAQLPSDAPYAQLPSDGLREQLPSDQGVIRKCSEHSLQLDNFVFGTIQVVKYYQILFANYL